MKRRKTIYDYGREYHHGKFIGWYVWKVKAEEDDSLTMASFYGKKSRVNAQEFCRKLNHGELE